VHPKDEGILSPNESMSATMKPLMKSITSIFDTGVLSYAFDAIDSIGMELMVFAVALISYLVLARVRLQARCRLHQQHKLSQRTEFVQSDFEYHESESCHHNVEHSFAEEEDASASDATKHLPVSVVEVVRPPSAGVQKALRQLASPLDTVLQNSKDKPGWCTNMVVVSGHRSKVKAAGRTFRKHGFLKSSSDGGLPLDGHWETDHGLNVIIEGKLVRWTYQRASRLNFAKVDKRSCQLMLYGEFVQGHLVTSTIPGVVKTLQWENGDVWHSYGSRRIDKEEVFLQTMTKIRHDDTQDDLVRARIHGRLRAASKDGLGLLPHCVDQVLQYIGSDRYYFNVCFDTPSGHPWSQNGRDLLGMVSKRHPHVEIHHCWAEAGDGSFGERKIEKSCDIDL